MQADDPGNDMSNFDLTGNNHPALSYIPAPKFHEPNAMWESVGNLTGVRLQGLDLGIGEVIFI